MIDREEMIRLLKERIEWLENNPDGEEFNVHELAAAKDYLAKLDPPELNLEEGYYAEEKSLERFWKSLDARAEFDEERQKFLAGEARKRLPLERTEEREDVPVGERGKAEDSADKKKTGSIFLYFAYHRGMAACVVVAVLVLAMLAGGTAGAYAQSRGGIFHFLKNDEEGMEVIVSPEDDDVIGEFYLEDIFDSIEEIPENYLKLLTLPSVLCDKYFLDYIRVQENNRYVLFRFKYLADNKKNYIECDQAYFGEELSYYSRLNDNYVLFEKETLDSFEIEYFESYNKDEIEYAANFRDDRNAYFIKTNIAGDEIKNMVSFLIKEIK